MTAGPLPRQVDVHTKERILKLVDEAVSAGMGHARACRILGVPDDRLHRWRHRLRTTGTLADRAPGGVALHSLLDWEVQAILDLAEEWGPIDRSHRKLAHRGSRLGAVHVSESTVRRVLIASGQTLPEAPARRPVPARDLPDWVTWEPNRIWQYDVTHFSGCPRLAIFGIVDVVSRYWIDTLVSVEETSSQVKVVFAQALQAQALLDLLTPERVDLPEDDPRRPILLASSDNGPQMRSDSTREFMALVAIAQHFGRPHTPTDQAFIETLWGHVKSDWPHLDDIDDDVVLEAELGRVRREYNSVRLHASIGYVTPEDEHLGRGDAIRQARRQGLQESRRARIEHNRQQHENHQEDRP